MSERPSADDPAPASEANDPGIEVVRRYHEAFSIDPEWTVWDGRGFTWWGHRHAQRVWAETPTEGAGNPAWRVTVETELMTLPELDEEDGWALSELGRQSSLSGLVLDGGDAYVRATAWVHEGNADWLTGVLQVAGLHQVVGIERHGEQIAELFDAAPLHTPPASGPRGEPDEMLSALDDPPPVEGWSDPAEFEELAEALGSAGIEASAEGGRVRAAIADGVTLTARPVETVSGTSLALELRLDRWPIDFTGARLLPVHLNRLELTDPCHAHGLGSWAIDTEADEPAPEYVSLVPAILARPGVLLNMAMSMAVRGRWIAERLG